MEINMAEEVRKALEQAWQQRGHVNVLLAGRSGVGKSTLINAVFQGDFAKTGQGRPVSPGTREISKEGIPLTLFDTRGLEMADFDATLGALEALITERKADKDPKRHVHVAWVCITEDGRRVEEAESRLVEMLARNMPVIAVITKARADGGFRAVVSGLLPQAKNVVRVRALPERLDDGHELKPFGLEDLVNLTMEVVPEGQRNAFAAAQKASLDAKRMRAHAVVATSAVAAGGIGAAPIPFADAALLVPLQVGMLASISAVFGMNMTTGFLSTLVAAAAGAGGATFAGRVLVANLLKLVPGGGTIAGAVISAATAAAFTTALGEMYIATLTTVFAATGGEPPSDEAVITEFKRRLPGGAGEPATT